VTKLRIAYFVQSAATRKYMTYCIFIRGE